MDQVQEKMMKNKKKLKNGSTPKFSSFFFVLHIFYAKAL